MRRDQSRELAALVSLLGEQARPRMAGSPAEATMAALVNGRLRRYGMGVATYPLRVVKRPGRGYLLLGLLGCSAFLLSPLLAWPSLFLALVVLLGLGLTLPPLGRLVASQTIMGVREIEGAAGLAPRSPRWRVVVLAPLDSPLAWQGFQAIAGPSRSAVLGRLAFGCLVCLGPLAALWLPGYWWLLGLPGALGCCWLVLAALQPPTAALPDGSLPALAALLTLAQRSQRLRQVELWTGAVGATASDPRGMALILSQLPFERTQTIFIALEQLAGTQLGCVLPTQASPLLRQLAQALQLPSCSPQQHATQIAPLLQRHGYQCLSIVSQAATPTAPRASDPQLVAQVVGLVLALIEQLEETVQGQR